MKQTRPYADRAYRQVYAPAVRYGRKSYDEYGAPRVAKLQRYGMAQWETFVRPQLEVSRLRAKQQYDATLGPRVHALSAAVGPYYGPARDVFTQQYKSVLMPAYKASLPYVQRGYDVARRFTLDTGMPYASWAGSNSWAFVNRKIFPQLRIFYGENIEPPLTRITERLGRYKDGKKVEAVFEAEDR